LKIIFSVIHIISTYLIATLKLLTCLTSQSLKLTMVSTLILLTKTKYVNAHGILYGSL
jgi:hypothetical protein